MQKTKLSKAVILAGGKGTRLYPITKEHPKPLLRIGKKPIINYLVDLFFAHGIHTIAVLVNKEFREDFDWWLKRYYPDKNITIFEESEPLGTFGGLALLKNWISADHFFMSNSDELKETDLGAMISLHMAKQPIATVALAKVQNPREYGVAVVKDDFVEEFLEKPEHPPSDFINSGLYLFSPEIFSYHPGLIFSMVEKDIFPRLAKEKKLVGFKSKGKWVDCGTWERYEKALEQWNA